MPNSKSVVAGGSAANGGLSANTSPLAAGSSPANGDISPSLEKMKQNEQQFEHGQGAHERQERMKAAVRMIMTPTIGVSGKC